MSRPTAFRDRNFLLMIFYEGPWERLENIVYGIRKDGSARWDIPADPRGAKKILDKLGRWLDERDKIWRAKHAIRRTQPHARWKRRVP